MTTDFPSSFEGKTMMQIVGSDMSRAAANDLYENTGIGPDDVEVVELHDCFTSNEIITYEALQLTEEGGSEQFVSDGDNTYGGKVVVIPQAGFCPKAIPWEQPDSANVQNWSGNFEGRQAPGRWKEPGLVSSIILVWEAPV